MGTFGDRLRRERETRGVTLGEISESTKISSGFLRALEQEDFEKLPGGIFNRGFVRAYCTFLGIDEESMVTDFDSAYEEYRTEQIKLAPVVPIAPPKKSIQFPKSYLAFLVPVVVLIVVTAIWWHRRSARGRETIDTVSAASQSTASTNDTQQNGAANRASIQANGAVNTAEQKKQNFEKAEVRDSVTEKATKKVDVAGHEAIAKRNLETIAMSPELARLNAPIRLEIRAHEDSWLSVVADGKTLMEGILPRERSKSFRAQRNMVFTTGNAGGVELSYNGKPLPSLGTNNEVKSLRFTPAGLRQ